MKRPLTKTIAKALIQRETGICPTKLEAPADMNHDSNYPWFKLTSGNLQINVYVKDSDPEHKLIFMTTQNLNSGLSTTECYFSDTLEYAAEVTLSYYWEHINEITEETDPMFAHRRWLEAAWAANRQRK